MSNTSNLVLPFLAAGQAQKHVTLNESLRKLDALVQLSVISATTTVEPSSPTDGAVYIVPAGKSGTHWSAYANSCLAYYRDGSWVEIAPREGWLAFVRDTGQMLHCTGPAWALFAVGKAITVSATDKVLGRASSGAGAAEEIACTAAGRALIDDADAAAQRATLGLGAAALKNTGSSGSNVALLNGSNTWGATQTVQIATAVGPGGHYQSSNTSNGATAAAGFNATNDATYQAFFQLNGSGNSSFGGANSANLGSIFNIPLGFVVNNTLAVTIATSTYDLKTHSGKVLAAGGIGVGNSAAATTAVGALVRKIEVFDASGSSLGFVPVYSSIT